MTTTFHKMSLPALTPQPFQPIKTTAASPILSWTTLLTCTTVLEKKPLQVRARIELVLLLEPLVKETAAILTPYNCSCVCVQPLSVSV